MRKFPLAMFALLSVAITADAAGPFRNRGGTSGITTGSCPGGSCSPVSSAYAGQQVIDATATFSPASSLHWMASSERNWYDLMRGGDQIGCYCLSSRHYYARDGGGWAPNISGCPIPFVRPAKVAVIDVPGAVDALDEVNAQRAARGLRPYLRDEGLTRAAAACARHRAANRIAGHCSNDFSFLPAGTSATVAGCAAWRDGFGACGLFEDHTYCGAAVVIGRDGLRYCHCFYR